VDTARQRQAAMLRAWLKREQPAQASNSQQRPPEAVCSHQSSPKSIAKNVSCLRISRLHFSPFSALKIGLKT
jgi:hypothetical protein